MLAMSILVFSALKYSIIKLTSNFQKMALTLSAKPLRSSATPLAMERLDWANSLLQNNLNSTPNGKNHTLTTSLTIAKTNNIIPNITNHTFKVPATPPLVIPTSTQSNITDGWATLRYAFRARALACSNAVDESSAMRSVKERDLRHACFPDAMSNANFLAAGRSFWTGTTASTRPIWTASSESIGFEVWFKH